MRSFHARLGFALLLSLAFTLPSFAQEDDQLPIDALSTARNRHASVGPKGHTNGMAHARFGTFGIDTIPSFNGQFFVTGYDPVGNLNSRWFTNVVGNPPQMGGTTTINAPIIPVAVDLRNADGSPRFINGVRLISHATQYAQPVVDSPVFSNSTWDTSATPTQITDAVQRAEFWKSAKSDWHTVLSPTVKAERTMVLNRGTYLFSLNSDGTCCRFILVDFGTFVNKLFPPTFPVDNKTVIGAAELAGDMTPQDVTTLLFPNTYLFDGSPNNCCVLGFHSFDYEPGVPENGNKDRFYVMNYSSWISPGLFGDAFTDVTAVSHEVAELYNDPFVSYDGIHNITPWWLAPNGLCQNNFETGDVIEGLPNATFPTTMPNGFTYHPQNEALLQWFEFLTPSDAYKGAYSFPDRTVLTAPSAPQKYGCQ